MDKYKSTVEDIIHKSNLTADIRRSKDETVYKLVLAELEMVITLSDSWVGFELSIPKTVLGKSVGYAEDTDNYPLGNGNEGITAEIFDELVNCLQAVTSGEVYIGKQGRRSILALPDGTSYRVFKAATFTMTRELLSKEDFLKLHLRRVNINK